MKTAKSERQHAQSGCTDYLQHSAESCPHLREMVDLIAAGYEWVCPHCDKLNHEIEVTASVTCRVTWWEGENLDEIALQNLEPCGKTYNTQLPEHAYGNS